MGRLRLPIYRLLKDASLERAEMARLDKACKRALRLLYLVDRDDRLAEIVARKVIEIDQSGVRDPTEIAKFAVRSLSGHLAVQS